MRHLSDRAPDALEARLGFEFPDRSLLEQALTHKSHRCDESGQPLPCNERLEFLGDAGLGTTLAVHLYTAHPDWSHGELTAVKAAAVSAATLSRVGRELGLGEFLLLGKGEEQSGGRERPSILADALEAIIGAVFLETVVTNRHRYAAHEIVHGIVEPLLRIIVRHQPNSAPEAVLRELGESAHGAIPACFPVHDTRPDQPEPSVAEVRLGCRFRDPGLLQQALTHASYHSTAADQPPPPNGRLAFVGNAFVNSTVATHLYVMCHNCAEGELTRLRVFATGERVLGRIGRELGLGELVLLGTGEEQNGGRERSSILAGAVKALWAAVCLDAPGVDPQRQRFREFVLGILGPSLAVIERDPQQTDPKTVFQELAQQKRGLLPTYHVVRESGPDHSKMFAVEARLGNHILGVGRGRSKRAAEQNAARRALETLESGSPGTAR